MCAVLSRIGGCNVPKPPSQEIRVYRQHRAKVLSILRAYEEHPNPNATTKEIRKLLGKVVTLMLRDQVQTVGDDTP